MCFRTGLRAGKEFGAVQADGPAQDSWGPPLACSLPPKRITACLRAQAAPFRVRSPGRWASWSRGEMGVRSGSDRPLCCRNIALISRIYTLYSRKRCEVALGVPWVCMCDVARSPPRQGMQSGAGSPGACGCAQAPSNRPCCTMMAVKAVLRPSGRSPRPIRPASCGDGCVSRALAGVTRRELPPLAESMAFATHGVASNAAGKKSVHHPQKTQVVALPAQKEGVLVSARRLRDRRRARRFYIGRGRTVAAPQQPRPALARHLACLRCSRLVSLAEHIGARHTLLQVPWLLLLLPVPAAPLPLPPPACCAPSAPGAISCNGSSSRQRITASRSFGRGCTAPAPRWAALPTASSRGWHSSCRFLWSLLF